MRDSRNDTVLARLRAIFTTLRDDPRNDDELLRRFAEEHNEDAFSAVVGRHAPLVWRTCCRVLGQGPDAEDAFQVTFLTLARWAKRPRYGSLAGWLFQVARRAAQRVRAATERRRTLERQQTVEMERDQGEDLERAETYRLLDEELAELPERLRVPLVLRYLEGKTLEEVARILGCSRRAVGKRLARGEGILRERLCGRGVTVGMGAVAGLLAGTSAGQAAVQSRLITETTRLAMAFCAGRLDSPMAQAALALLPGKASWTLKNWLVILFGVGFLLAGAVGWQVIPSVPAIPAPPIGDSDATPAPTAARPAATRPAPAGPLVVGEVTDADGKPVPKAEVVVLAGGVSELGRLPEPDRPVWKGRTGEDGRFHARLPAKLPTDSSGGLPVRILASGGEAIGAAAATYKREGPPVTIQLGDGGSVSRTVIGQDRRPVAKARVRVWRIGPVWVRPSADVDRDPEPIAAFWPKSVVTDEEGKFSLPKLGGISPVIAEVLAPKWVRTDALLSGRPVTIMLLHPRWVAGKVRAAATGKPVRGAEIGYPAQFSVIGTPGDERAGCRPMVAFPVGEDGAFRFSVPPHSNTVLWVQPPVGSRLLPLLHLVDTDGPSKGDIDLSLSSVDP